MAKRNTDTTGLTDQQEKFCIQYAMDPEHNGTKAAEKAGYSPETAASQASRLLKNAKIQERIKILLGEQNVRVLNKADDVLRELKRIGYSDPRGIFDDKGGLLDPNKWPDDIARAIASVEIEELFDGYGENREQIGFTKKIKFWPKVHALELLGKNLKMFTDKIEVDDKSSLAARLARAKAKRDK